MVVPLSDLSRLCVHTITTKPWSLDEAVERYARTGVSGITVWRQSLAGNDVAASGRMIRERGLSIVSLCRGGFFPGTTAAERQAAIDENRHCIDEAAALGAPLIVLVCGSAAGQSLAESRRQIADGIAAVVPHAAAANVRLAIEPLHPMYAADRSAINTIAQAREICGQLRSPLVGVAVDVYHVWWDPNLEQEIAALGREKSLFAYHICDWKTPIADVLNDRGLMGEGHVPLREIRSWVEAAGFNGFNEVEIFSERYWAMDQAQFLDKIVEAYRTYA